MSALPRKAARLVDALNRLAADPAASPNEVAMARTEVERLLRRHGLSEAPTTRAPRVRGPVRRLGSGSTSRTWRKAPEAPIRMLAPSAVLDAGADWALALGASVAEALGASLVASTGPGGCVCLAFAGAGDAPELAAASWRMLHEQTEGRSDAWCVGFAATVDERLDATIERADVRARVERVERWLARDPMTTEASHAPLLLVDDEGAAGVAAALELAL